MTTPSKSELTKLLVSMFTSRELRTLAEQVDEEIVHSLPEGESTSTLAVAERIIEAVVHRGLQFDLRDRLVATRSRRADEIDALFGRSAATRRSGISSALDSALRDAGVRTLQEYLVEGTPGQEDLLYEAFRSMAFGRSRAAWPLIARLTVDYLANHGGQADAFLRRAAWLLERCEEEDVDLLRDALRSCFALLASLPQTSTGAGVGIEWGYSDVFGLYLQTNPTPLPHGHLLVDSWEKSRQLELINLVGQARLGVHRDGHVHFPVRDGVLQKLIELFCPGERPRPTRTTAMVNLEVPHY